MHFLFFRAIKIPVFLIPVLIVGIVLGIMGYFYMSFHYSYRDTASFFPSSEPGW
jgi:hypothetical protein